MKSVAKMLVMCATLSAYAGAIKTNRGDSFVYESEKYQKGMSAKDIGTSGRKKKSRAKRVKK